MYGSGQSRYQSPEQDVDPEGQWEGGERCEQEEDHVLDDELAPETGAARAHGEASRHLAPAHGMAREQHARDIAAGDGQEPESQREEKAHEGGKRHSEAGGETSRRRQNDSVDVGELGLERAKAFQQCRELGLGARAARSGTQSAECRQPHGSRVLQQVFGPWAASRADHRHGNPQIRADETGAVEILPRDAHDLELRTVEPESRAHDARVGSESTRPEAVRQHGDGALAWHRVFVGEEEASPRRQDAQDSKVVDRDRRTVDAHPLDLMRPVVHAQAEGGWLRRRGGHGFESPGVVAEVLVHGVRQRVVTRAAGGPQDRDDALSVLDTGTRLEEELLAEIEDDGGSGDPEGKREGCRRREERTALEESGGEARVLDRLGHEAQGCHRVDRTATGRVRCEPTRLETQREALDHCVQDGKRPESASTRERLRFLELVGEGAPDVVPETLSEISWVQTQDQLERLGRRRLWRRAALRAIHRTSSEGA